MRTLLTTLYALAVGATVLWSYLVPDRKAFLDPELARIFFYHFPCAILTSVLVLLAPYFGIRLLGSKNREWDVRAVAANELGFLFALCTMATGILFSKAQWGAWWHWDPRQSSFLIVLLLYGAYFALRAAFTDEAQRAANSAAYSVATALPSVFLIFVYPRLPRVQTLHPNTTILGGELATDYRRVVTAMLVLFAVLAVWVYRTRVRVGQLELELEKLDGLETGGGDPAPTGVVRPLSVPDESRAKAESGAGST